jgi:hypothetical protein
MRRSLIGTWTPHWAPEMRDLGVQMSPLTFVTLWTKTSKIDGTTALPVYLGSCALLIYHPTLETTEFNAKPKGLRKQMFHLEATSEVNRGAGIL